MTPGPCRIGRWHRLEAWSRTRHSDFRHTVRNRVLSGDKGCAFGRGLLTVVVGERTSFLGDARMGGNAFTCETPLCRV